MGLGRFDRAGSRLQGRGRIPKAGPPEPFGDYRAGVGEYAPGLAVPKRQFRRGNQVFATPWLMKSAILELL